MKWMMGLVLVLLLATAALFFLSSSTARQADFAFATAADVKSLDPQGTSWLHDFRIIECLYEPLLKVKLDGDLPLEPGAATAWSVSEDQLTYTFTLRPEGRWSDGSAVTAGDFVRSWRRALLADLAGDYSSLLFPVRGGQAFFEFRTQQLDAYVKGTDKSEAAARKLYDQAMEQFSQTVGVRAQDDRTLVIELARPVAYFLELCAFAVTSPIHAGHETRPRFSADTGRLMRDAGYFTDPARLVGNGPYLLKRYRFKQDMLLEANPHYWNRAAMGNGSIMQRLIADPQTALLAYGRGEVDWLPDIPTASPVAADLVNRGRPDVHMIPAAGVYEYVFNCKPTLPDGSINPLADARVRRALSMGIDRRSIVESVTRLHQPIAMTIIPPHSLPGYEPPIEAGVEYNPEQARKLLAEAGYPGGKGMPRMSILYNTEGGHETLAQAVQYAWRTQLGVDVALEGVEVGTFSDRRRKSAFTIARAGWFGDYRDPTTFLERFITGDGNNDGDYRNPMFDQLMRKAAEQTHAAERLATLRQAESLLLSEQPRAPIYQYVELNVFDPSKVRGISPNMWKFRRLEQVRVTR